MDDDTPVNVRVSKRAKYAHLAVHADGRVEVTVPRAFPQHALIEFVTENRDWIEKKLQVLEQRKSRNPELYSLQPTIIDLPAIDEYWTVDYQQGKSRQSVKEQEPGLFLQLKVTYNAVESIPLLLQKWLQQKAKKILPPMVEQCSQETGLRYNCVSVRGQKTCWGSCSSKQRISLNRGLLFLSPQILRYLILHELCHTRYMNHSRKFWDLVCKFEPAARELDRQISGSAEKIPLWAQAAARHPLTPKPNQQK